MYSSGKVPFFFKLSRRARDEATTSLAFRFTSANPTMASSSASAHATTASSAGGRSRTVAIARLEWPNATIQFDD